MKNGDKIKAFVQVGLMKNPRWLKGDYVQMVGEEHQVIVSGNTLMLAVGKVKSWIPLGPSVLEDFAASNWELLKEVVADSVAKFFPDEEVRCDEDEKTLHVGELSVGPGIVERESIASFREIPVWSVTYWRTIAATYWEPADADEVACGESAAAWQVAKILIDQLWAFKTESYWDSISPIPEDSEAQW
jgi:hypothetical protein